MFFNSFSQIDDYTSAEFQLNHAVQRVTREFAMIGLGMPNNRDGSGSFAWSFRLNAPPPITASFGPPAGTPNEEHWLWGGPVTVAAGNSTNFGPVRVDFVNPQANGGPNRNLFIGPQLFYAWAAPTGVRATVRGMPGEPRPANAVRDTQMQLETRMGAGAAVSGENALRNVRWDGRAVGLMPADEAAGGSHNVRSWVLFPTLRIPMLANSFEAVASPNNSVLNVTIAPAAAGAPPLAAPEIMDLDEIHLMQAARIYRDAASNELRRVVLTEHNPAATFSHEVLARNVVGLQFAFDPESRILTMFMAARGNERNPAIGSGQFNWPAWLPDQIAAEDALFRIVVKTLSWRVRN